MSDRLQEVTSQRKGPKQDGFGAWVAGRAGRREYWLWVGPLLVAVLALAATGLESASIVLGFVILLIWIRRLHDLGRSGWWAPLINIVVNLSSVAMGALLPVEAAALGALLLLLTPIVVLGALPGQPHDNAYGAARRPKGAADLGETFS